MLKIFPVLLLLMLSGCSCRERTRAAGGDNRAAGETEARPGRADKPVQYTYKVTGTYPHQSDTYTQGLYWHDGYLWESKGQYGESALLKVDLPSGRILERRDLPADYFGEGIALLDGKIYQLTWIEKTVLVYDAATLEQTGTMTYEGEGWGLTTDGQRLYMSDGTNVIRVVNPADFSTVSRITVRNGNRPVRNLNDLEWIEGRIWANIYGSDAIVIINPSDGSVEGIVDLTDLLPRADRHPGVDVLNGIAYDRQTKTIYVTGKNWPRLFSIEPQRK